MSARLKVQLGPLQTRTTPFDSGADICHGVSLALKAARQRTQYNLIMPINKTSKVKDNIKPESSVPGR